MSRPAASDGRANWRARVGSIAVAALGSGLIVITLAADLVLPERRGGQEFGIRQRLVLLAGIGILVTGVLLWPGLRRLRRVVWPWVVVVFVAAVAAVLSTSPWDSVSSWVLIGYVLAACLLLPRGLGAITLVGVICIVGALTAINAVKIDLTGMPLTMLDLRIAIADPWGLWNALQLPIWSLYCTLAVVAIVILGWGLTSLAALAQLYASRRDRRSIIRVSVRLLAVAVLATAVHLYLKSLYELPKLAASNWLTYEPAGVAELANSMGIVPFLAYSYALESAATGDIYAQSDATAPDREEIRKSVLRVANLAGQSGGRPNIMMILAESTFDPGAIFRIQGPWNRSLFEPGGATAAIGPLWVNGVGGGTWITEFETLVGIDARVFGYSGYYTHAAVAPFVTRSLATHLADRGYRSTVFIPHDGGFFNARRAYAKYGFETILDSRDLGRYGPRDWFSSDVEIAKIVVDRLGPKPAQPFFVYVGLLENHYPHDCKLARTHRFATRFIDTEEFEPNCSLYEYLRRLESTTASVTMLTEYLKDIESDTGRPYVLAVFGDHQPATFTTPRYGYDVGAYRRGANLNQTFFRIETSTKSRLQCCDRALPASVLPALVSTFAADEPDDVYLGVNLWLFEHCGSDAVQRSFAANLAVMAHDGNTARTTECQSAYERTLTWYRSSGIVRIEPD